MNAMSQSASAGRPVIAESINRAHRNAGEVEAILRDLLSDLEGSYADDACGANASGLIYQADNLADRIVGLIALAERVRGHVSQAKVVEFSKGLAVAQGIG